MTTRHLPNDEHEADRAGGAGAPRRALAPRAVDRRGERDRGVVAGSDDPSRSLQFDASTGAAEGAFVRRFRIAISVGSTPPQIAAMLSDSQGWIGDPPSRARRHERRALTLRGRPAPPRTA